MLPKKMGEQLHEFFPSTLWDTRRKEENGLNYLEFNSNDVEILRRMGIEVDNLGPKLVVCMWNEHSPLEIGGYLVVDNIAVGTPAMGASVFP